MPNKKAFPLADIRFLLRAVWAWMCAACLLLLLCSLMIARSNLSAGAMGYISSALSFLTAAYAGAASARSGNGARLLIGIVTGLAVSLLLLTVGFLIAGSGMSSAGILSVVSFSLAGSLVGAVFFGGKLTRNKGKRFASAKRTGMRGFHK